MNSNAPLKDTENRLLETFGELLHGALLKSGMSRQEYGRQLGIDQSEMSRRFSGQRNLTLRTVARMLDAAGYELRVSLRQAQREPTRTSEPPPSSEEIERRLRAGRQRQAGLDYERLQLAKPSYLGYSNSPDTAIGGD